MAKPLADYAARNNLSPEEVAAQLTVTLGRPITVKGVKNYLKFDRIPRAWGEALGIAAGGPPPTTSSPAHAWGLGADDLDGGGEPAQEPSSPVDGNGGDPDTHKAAGAPTPPKPPPGQFRPQSASSAGTGEYSAVRDRIAKFYGAIGAGASMISQNDGYGLVADAYSGDLADAWIAAARQNENVARIVAFLESGGPVGELVIAHFILVGGMVYVSGRGPDLDFLYAGKFAAHRAAAAASRAADIAQAEADAAAQAGLDQNGGGFAYTYSVDDTPSAPGQ